MKNARQIAVRTMRLCLEQKPRITISMYVDPRIDLSGFSNTGLFTLLAVFIVYCVIVLPVAYAAETYDTIRYDTVDLRALKS